MPMKDIRALNQRWFGAATTAPGPWSRASRVGRIDRVGERLQLNRQFGAASMRSGVMENETAAFRAKRHCRIGNPEASAVTPAPCSGVPPSDSRFGMNRQPWVHDERGGSRARKSLR